MHRFSQHSLWRIIACILAANYFAFQVELFEEEYEAHHRQPAKICSVGSSTLDWESFDKDNAPKAFTFRVELSIQFLFVVDVPLAGALPAHEPYRTIRDKSPPFSSNTILISLDA